MRGKNFESYISFQNFPLDKEFEFKIYYMDQF